MKKSQQSIIYSLLHIRTDMSELIYTHGGQVFEILEQYGICTVLNDIAQQTYYCATKVNIVDSEIHWQTASVFEKKQQAVKLAQEVDKMYEMLKNRALVEKVGYKLDDEIKKNRNGDNFDECFDITLKEMKDEYSTFDICAAVALAVNSASDWDRRYSNASIQWAKDFLYENDIEPADYKSIRLSNTQPVILNGFAEFMMDNTKGISLHDLHYVKDEELDLTEQSQDRGR